MKRIEVVAAIIRKNDRIFATQRGYGDWKDWWEFPGGKMEAGESPEEALHREIREELDTDISIDKFLHTVEWDYTAFHLTLHCYLCSLTSEALHLNEHEAARWLGKGELDSVKWLPADLQLLPMIAEELEKGFIRKADAKDLSAVNGLLEQVLAVHHEGRPDLFRAAGKKYTDEELLAIFSNPETPVFVYEAKGRVLGYAFCEAQVQESGSLLPLKTLYIDDICVDGSARGRHIGKALFEYVKDFAKAEGFYNITLHVWACNPGARAFYEAMGMKPQYTSMELICEFSQ